MSSYRGCFGGVARAAALTAILGAATVLAGCAEIMPKGYDLPESPEVEAAPWPRLIDAPAAASRTTVKDEIAHGQAVQADIDAEAAALAAEAAAMNAKPVVTDSGLAKEAAALRASGREVDAAQ